MAYGTLLWIAAIIALPQDPPAKKAADAPPSATTNSPDRLKEARHLLRNGRYAEAEEKLTEIRDQSKKAPEGLTPVLRVTLALDLAECQASQGEYAKAIDGLKAAELENAKNADIPARLADLHLWRGDWEAAAAAAARAVTHDPNHLQARFVQARLLELKGDLEKSVDAFKWFVDRYNEKQAEIVTSAEALVLVGQASERYYRARALGEELADSLNAVINDIYEAASRVDPNCWQAPCSKRGFFSQATTSGRPSRSSPALSRSTHFHPKSWSRSAMPTSRATGWRRGAPKPNAALATNPHFAPAFVLLADLNISDERFLDAKAAAQKAVAENPRDEDALARLAASCRLLVDPVGAAAAEARALANNPRAATFYSALGERLADRRKYPSAERAFILASAADPSRADAPIGLGMLYMQIGREAEAKSLFDTAFAADPFNVRALNMIRVLKHMASYSSIDSAHFSVVIDPTQDELLARYMSKYLESAYPKLTSRFGYAPPGRTKIEILKDHQWFSGRTLGQRFIPTVGACTGKVVALASPRATRVPFNWARVLAHEVVHVITLQQTEFNIPHWYTEALAVESEGFPRPQDWNRLLLERVPKRNKLLNLDTINLGFIRPNEPDDRQMAYCQAQLYARYMLKRFGSDALIKMLMAYRRGLTTDLAIADSFHVDKADFEKGYLAFLDDVIKTIRTRLSEEPVKFSELERKLKEKPEDPDLNAQMAYEHWARRDLKEARPFADKALELKPHHPLASYVKAQLLVTIGDDDAALQILEPALDPLHPNERVIDLLGELLMKAGRLDESEKLYEIARKDDPFRTKWISWLARIHLRQKKTEQFLADLVMIASFDADNIDIRRELAVRVPRRERRRLGREVGRRVSVHQRL